MAYDISCIAIQDVHGNYLTEFELYYDVWVPVRMSPDLQYLALFRTFSIHDESLEIYSINGEYISGDNELKSRSFHWIPNGSNRLEYPKNNRSLYFTKPFSTEEDYYLTLPDSIEDSIYDFDFSPEGSQIVFTITDATQTFMSQAPRGVSLEWIP
jgi:hypothetical protein